MFLSSQSRNRNKFPWNWAAGASCVWRHLKKLKVTVRVMLAPKNSFLLTRQIGSDILSLTSLSCFLAVHCFINKQWGSMPTLLHRLEMISSRICNKFNLKVPKKLNFTTRECFFTQRSFGEKHFGQKVLLLIFQCLRKIIFFKKSLTKNFLSTLWLLVQFMKSYPKH